MGVIVIGGTQAVPWLSVTLLGVVACFFALLSITVVRMSSALAIRSRDALLQQILPGDAAAILLDEIARRTGMSAAQAGRRSEKLVVQVHRQKLMTHLSMAGSTAEGPDPSALASDVSLRSRRRRNSRVAPGTVTEEENPSARGAGQLSAGEFHPMVFCREVDDLTVIGITLPAIQKLIRAGKATLAVHMIHQLHCIFENMAAQVPGLVKVDPLDARVLLAAALNLNAPLHNHREVALRIVPDLFHSIVGLPTWQVRAHYMRALLQTL